MSKNIYKPRYTLAHLTKNKIWPYKDSYLRRFYELRARRVQRGGLFRRNVLVANTRKWVLARRFFRPYSRRTNKITGGAGKTAYGRPRKRQYRETFDRKQQLRFFHGKVKEDAFRQFFRYYRSTVGKPSTAFFSALESRLDRVFFRRRLLPTIFASHQFIQHQGLIVNGALEKSPRAIIRVGDTVEIPESVWKPFYWDLFCRVYYRRWGLFIFRRRQYTQLKKKLFSVKTRDQRKVRFNRYFTPTIKTLFTTGAPKVSGWKTIEPTSFGSSKNLATSSAVQSFYSRYQGTTNFKFARGRQTNPFNRSRGSLVVHKHIQGSTFADKVQSLLTDFNGYVASGPQSDSTFYTQVRVPHLLKKDAGALASLVSRDAKRIKKPQSKSKASQISEFQNIEQIQSFTNYFITYRKEANVYADDSVESKNLNLFIDKLQQLQKLVISRRLRKVLLPSISTSTLYKGQKTLYKGSPARKQFVRAQHRLLNKQKRLRKVARLKAVHRYIPAYLQRDFRTLRAVKIKSPGAEEIYHPFRASFAKRRSFYKVRGR